MLISLNKHFNKSTIIVKLSKIFKLMKEKLEKELIDGISLVDVILS